VDTGLDLSFHALQYADVVPGDKVDNTILDVSVNVRDSERISILEGIYSSFTPLADNRTIAFAAIL